MRSLRVACLALLAGCALFPSLDGLGGGDASIAEAGADASFDAPFDAPFDALADVALDAPADASSDADAGPSCGFPGPTLGLVAYYPFEEGQGTVVHDCTSSHLDGTFVTQAGWTTGKKGGGIAVSSSGGCVDVGAPSQFQQLSTFTVTAWVEIASFPAIGASGYIVGQSVNADVSGWRIGTIETDAGGFLQWDHTVGSTHYHVTAPAPPLSSWHALAMIFTPNGTSSLWLDGAVAASQTGFPAVSYDGSDLRIGCRSDGNNLFNGSLDEVRIYARALGQTEIASLAQ